MTDKLKQCDKLQEQTDKPFKQSGRLQERTVKNCLVNFKRFVISFQGALGITGKLSEVQDEVHNNR